MSSNRAWILLADMPHHMSTQLACSSAWCRHTQHVLARTPLDVYVPRACFVFQSRKRAWNQLDTGRRDYRAKAYKRCRNTGREQYANMFVYAATRYPQNRIVYVYIPLACVEYAAPSTPSAPFTPSTRTKLDGTPSTQNDLLGIPENVALDALC